MSYAGQTVGIIHHAALFFSTYTMEMTASPMMRAWNCLTSLRCRTRPLNHWRTSPGIQLAEKQSRRWGICRSRSGTSGRSYCSQNISSRLSIPIISIELPTLRLHPALPALQSGATAFRPRKRPKRSDRPPIRDLGPWAKIQKASETEPIRDFPPWGENARSAADSDRALSL